MGEAAAGSDNQLAPVQRMAPTLQPVQPEIKTKQNSKANPYSKEKDKAKDKVAMYRTNDFLEIDSAHRLPPLAAAPPNEPVLGAPFAVLTTDLIKLFPAAHWCALKRAWDNRPFGFRLTTPGYQSAQLRMLPFLLVHEQERSKTFLRV